MIGAVLTALVITAFAFTLYARYRYQQQREADQRYTASAHMPRRRGCDRAREW